MDISSETVDGKIIYIINNAFSQDEIEAFYEYAIALPYKRLEKSLSYDEFPIFSTDFIPEKFETETFIGKKARNLLEQLFANGPAYGLMRSYINLCSYGDVEYPHRDCPIGQNDLTGLYYVNKEWNYKYGGETLFYSEKDSRLAILPQPGRLVFFPGDIEHMGSIPTRICKVQRLSLAMKFKLK
jgi:SM-20-related protein